MSQIDTHGEHPETVTRNARIGLVLFAIYVFFYAGFMILAVFFPHLMSSTWLGGVNVAIKYGMGLILVAFVLAAIYLFMTRRASTRS